MKINGDKVKYLTFENMETYPLRHAFSTRVGGVSEREFSSLNLGFQRGDEREAVIRNYELFCAEAGISISNLVFSDQVHKTNIYHASGKDRGKGIFSESDIKQIDALITNEPEVALTTFYADCVPLFFYDPIKKVAALAHAGWRGTVKDIGSLTVKEMDRVYGTEPENVLAGIGPSIGICCFEVDEPVYREFSEAFAWADEYIEKNEQTGKYFISLQDINKRLLMNAGVPGRNIELPGLCTKCRGDLFYSHRNMGALRGSLAAVICLTYDNPRR